MTPSPANAQRTLTNAALLFSIFFLIAFGLGYPILNRFDPRQTPGLSDVRAYAAIATGSSTFEPGDMRYRRFRVLVPWLARPFYQIARGRIGSWDPVLFGLLISDSIFIAGTALLIVVIGSSQFSSSVAGLIGALIYLVNFAVPNLRLVGLVDAGEGFFLLALLWCLSELKLWLLPIVAVLGALTKESFVPFSMMFSLTWWLLILFDRNRERGRAVTGRRETIQNRYLRESVLIPASWLLGIATVAALQWSITGMLVSPAHFASTLHRDDGYHFAVPLFDRNLVYTFAWLLPTAIPNLKRLPKSWTIPVFATCVLAFVMDAGFGGSGSAWGRALFSIAGPILSLSSALFLIEL